MTPPQQREFSLQLQSLGSVIYQALSCIVPALEQAVKSCFEPTKPYLIGGMPVNVTRSKSELIVENTFLRQQLLGL